MKLVPYSDVQIIKQEMQTFTVNKKKRRVLYNRHDYIIENIVEMHAYQNIMGNYTMVIEMTDYTPYLLIRLFDITLQHKRTRPTLRT